MMHRPALLAIAALLIATALPGAPARGATNWNVAWRSHTLLTPPGGVIVKEMSGVSYVGPAAGGNHTFIAVMEDANDGGIPAKGFLVKFDLSFDAVGAITGVSNVSQVLIAPVQDHEGIAYTNAARNSVFLSDEAPTPFIREVSLATGATLQNLGAVTPTVFTANSRPNLKFESLTRSLDAKEMWTANEAALTVDGPVATAAAGTTVRLLKFNVAGNTVTTGPQYAYNVSPIHDTNPLGSPQSGLSDLVEMPDGTLLALERSVAVAAPIYLNRIFEANLAGATDVSAGALGTGLIGQSYTPVGKQLLWSGPIDGPGNSGMNMEGLALGPRLANGSWVLVGVVDNGDGILSTNTLVSFTATSNTTADYNVDGRVDGLDFLAWQRGLGKTIGAKLADGDSDRDGDVDAADLQIWKAASVEPATAPTPEPTSAALAPAGLLALRFRRRPRCPRPAASIGITE